MNIRGENSDNSDQSEEKEMVGEARGLLRSREPVREGEDERYEVWRERCRAL